MSILLALVTATFILLQSFKNPIYLFELLLTIDMIIHSFSLPWMPSTVDTSTKGIYFYPIIDFIKATCFEYGVNTAIYLDSTPQSINFL